MTEAESRQTEAAAPSLGRLRETPKWQLLGMLLLVSYGYVWHNPGTNEFSRLILVYSIVFHGTLNVDAYHDATIDMAFCNGHYYTDKAPGLSFAAAPAMFVLKPLWLSVEPTEQMRNFLTVYLPRLAAVTLPSVVFGVLLFMFLRETGASEPYALMLTLSYGLGTLALPYSALFYGHQLGSVLGFGAFMLLFAIKDRAHSLRHCALAGLLAGLAVVVEYPMAAVGVILAAYLLATRRPVSHLAAYSLGGLAAVSVLLAYNHACFGSPFLLGYSFEKTEHFQKHLSEGIFGITRPQWSRFFESTFSPHRGIFTLSPFFYLAPFGWWCMSRDQRWRAEAWVCLAVLAVFILFTSSLYEESYAPGERQLIPVLPFLLLPLAFCAKGLRPWIVALGVLACSEWTVINFINPRVPPSVHYPFINTFLPRLLAGEHLDYNWGTALGAMTGIHVGPLATTLPFWLMQAALLAALFRRCRYGTPPAQDQAAAGGSSCFVPPGARQCS